MPFKQCWPTPVGPTRTACNPDGFGALVFAAIGVIIQLKDALNIVWEVKETQIERVWQFLRSHVVSLAAILALGFLLLTSMIITAAVAAFAHYPSAYLQEWVLHLVSALISLSIIGILFAMMFKWLPDAAVDWTDVWLGGDGDRRLIWAR
jgi:membrane protein